MSITTLTVPPDEADTRLDRWLKRRFPALTQGALQKMLRTGQVRVDGKRAEANTRLAAGAELRIPPMPTTQAPKAEPRPVPEAFAEELRGRVLHMDRSTGLVTVQAGMTLSALNAALSTAGLALPNLGDIAYQTVAGAISTATHITPMLSATSARNCAPMKTWKAAW